MNPRTKELLEELSAGVEELTSSERWTAYLDVQRKFHRYSFGNCLLIGLQRPDATQVAGFHRWRELGRFVRKGEKGIAILAPMVSRRTTTDEDTGEKSTTVSSPHGFRAVFVFDVAQTDGEDLPDVPVRRLEGTFTAYAELKALAEGWGWTVELETHLPDGANGYCAHASRRIVLDIGLEPVQSTKTLAHELGHAIMHEPGHELTRDAIELEAESVAYVVMGHLGVDAGAYSFGYLASWAGDDAGKGIRRSGERIQKASARILEAIEGVEPAPVVERVERPAPVEPVPVAEPVAVRAADVEPAGLFA